MLHNYLCFCIVSCAFSREENKILFWRSFLRESLEGFLGRGARFISADFEGFFFFFSSRRNPKALCAWFVYYHVESNTRMVPRRATGPSLHRLLCNTDRSGVPASPRPPRCLVLFSRGCIPFGGHVCPRLDNEIGPYLLDFAGREAALVQDVPLHGAVFLAYGVEGCAHGFRSGGVWSAART